VQFVNSVIELVCEKGGGKPVSLCNFLLVLRTINRS